MFKEKTPKIPTHESKKNIREKWYPNCPVNIIRQDLIDILVSNNKSAQLKYLNRKEIIQLFVEYEYGKPNIFSQQDYEEYINLKP